MNSKANLWLDTWKILWLFLFASVNIFQMDMSRKSLLYWKYKINRKKNNKLEKKKIIRLFQETSQENDTNICAKGTQAV